MAEDECPTKPNWLELPIDITADILSRLDTVDIVTSASLVCPLWWNIFKDPLIWHAIRIPFFHPSRYDMVKICRYAVERSCGHLEDIDIEYVCTDDLLKYIVECTSHLRRLRLYVCSKVSNGGFIEIVKKLPWLEELEITRCILLSKDVFEVIGRHCPLMKSWFLFFSEYIEFDVEAFAIAIAETMPKLCHLDIEKVSLILG